MSPSISVYFLLRRWPRIRHRDVVCSWPCISGRRVCCHILGAGVGIGRIIPGRSSILLLVGLVGHLLLVSLWGAARRLSELILLLLLFSLSQPLIQRVFLLCLGLPLFEISVSVFGRLLLDLLLEVWVLSPPGRVDVRVQTGRPRLVLVLLIP